MGGKSRKQGGVSKALIDRLLAGKEKKPPKKEKEQQPSGLGLKPSEE